MQQGGHVLLHRVRPFRPEAGRLPEACVQGKTYQKLTNTSSKARAIAPLSPTSLRMRRETKKESIAIASISGNMAQVRKREARSIKRRDKVPRCPIRWYAAGV